MNRTSGIVIAVVVVLALAWLIIANPLNCGDSQAKKDLETLKTEQAQLTDSLEYYKEIAQGCMPKPKKPKKDVQIVYRDRDCPPVEQKKDESSGSKNSVTEKPIYPPAPRNNVREVQEVIDFCLMYDLEEGWHAPHLWKNAGWSDYATGEVVANPKNDGYNFRIHSSQRTNGFVGRWGQTTDGTYFISAKEVDSKSPCNGCKIYLKCSENVWTPELMSLSSDGLYYYLLPR